MKKLALRLALALAIAAQPALAQQVEIPDGVSVEMPVTTFAANPQDALDFDKYFYFYRPETSYAEAYSDLLQCDDLSRGINPVVGYDPSTNYATNSMLYSPAAAAVGGLIGGMISGAMAAAETKNIRRHNMRLCMFYKGYARYGLPKDLWQTFNTEDLVLSMSKEERTGMLAKQAAVASGPAPETKELGL